MSQRLGGRCAKRDDEIRFDPGEFAIQPEAAGPHFAGIRPLVQAALAARLEFEMLHRVGDVSAGPVEAGFFQCFVEYLSRRSNEWLAGEVFLVARLFADEHHRRIARAFAEHGLCCVPEQRTTRAAFRLVPHRRKAAFGMLFCRIDFASTPGDPFGKQFGLIGGHVQHPGDALPRLQHHIRNKRRLGGVVPNPLPVGTSANLVFHARLPICCAMTAANAYTFHGDFRRSANRTQSSHARRLARVERLAAVLDTAFAIPFTKVRFGVDGLFGLAPVVGDVITTSLALYIVYEARRMGVPKHLVARMLTNVAVDGVIGAVPIAGDVFDVFWRANKRNVRILREHLERQGLT